MPGDSRNGVPADWMPGDELPIRPEQEAADQDPDPCDTNAERLRAFSRWVGDSSQRKRALAADDFARIRIHLERVMAELDAQKVFGNDLRKAKIELKFCLELCRLREKENELDL